MRPGRKALVPVAILGAGLLGLVSLLATRSGVEVEPPERVAPVVRVVNVQPRHVQLTVRSQGTVAPRTESDLIPEVSGPVVWVSPALVSGGFFEEGDPLLRVERSDYEVALERARAQLARTRSEHRRATRDLERRQSLKKREFASSAQLDDAENAEQVTLAAVREARAALEQAERNLSRTEVRAPYRGRVRSETVDVGQFVTRGAPIARLYATDYAEVRLPIPDEELAYLDLQLWAGEESDAPGPAVRLSARFAGGEHEWDGRVVRTEGEIDSRSRMVHVIARIDDPYARNADSSRPPLAVGLYVEAEIQGRDVERAIVVPRSAMHGRDAVLVVDAQDRLSIRSAEVLRAGREDVILRSGLAPGERVVVSALSVVVDGMQVRPVALDDSSAARRHATTQVKPPSQGTPPPPVGATRP